MARRLFVCLSALALSFGAGCAVVGTRSEELVSSAVYPAVRTDAFLWASCCWPDADSKWAVDYREPVQWMVTPVVTVGCLVDLVPSVVTDTVMLPFDLACGD